MNPDVNAHETGQTNPAAAPDGQGGGPRRGGLALGPKPRFLTKRDGRAVPYDRVRIAQAVARAQGALGEYDPAFADDVATVVELSLRRRALDEGADEAPDIESVQDLVEEALVELGRAKLAKAYILYRDRRARAREALRVRSSPPSADLPPGGLRVREAQRTAPWSKARIAAALIEELELPRNLAEEVSNRVETRVFASGLHTLSTGLIRALVDNELVDLGQSEALARHGPLTLARHDLRRALAGEGADVFERWGRRTGALAKGPFSNAAREDKPRALEGAIGGEILRRFALDEVLDERSAQLHMEGELSVEDLSSPHLYLTLGVPAELAMGGLSAEGGAFALLEGLGGILGAVSRGLVLEDTGAMLGELARATRPRSPLGLAGWLSGLAGLGAASGKRIDLVSPGARHGAARARLLEELAREDLGPFASRLFLDEEEYAQLASQEAGDAPAALAALARQGRLVLTWSSGEGSFAAQGCERREGERGLVALGGAVALNLPRLVRRAGPWREERVLEELSGLISCALEACRSLAAFQEATAAARPGPLRARLSYAIVPVGLREAQRLFGEGEADPALGARLLGLMGEAARRFPAPGAPPVRLSPFFGERAGRRLAWLDAGAPGAGGTNQGVLFGGADGGPSGSYSSGFLLSPLGGWRAGEPEAELARTVPTGALYPAMEASTARPSDASEALARFAERRSQSGRKGDAWLPLDGDGSAAERAAERAAVTSGVLIPALAPAPRRRGPGGRPENEQP